MSTRGLVSVRYVSEWWDMSTRGLVSVRYVSQWWDMSTRGLVSVRYVSEWWDMSTRGLVSVRYVSEWWDMSTRGLVSVRYHYTNPTKPVDLLQIGPHRHFILQCNLFSAWYSWKIAHLPLNNAHSPTPFVCIRMDEFVVVYWHGSIDTITTANTSTLSGDALLYMVWQSR